MSGSYSFENDDLDEDYDEPSDQRDKQVKRLRKKDMRRLIEERKEQKRWQCELENYEL